MAEQKTENAALKADAWQARISRCKTTRLELVQQWAESIQRRVGKDSITSRDTYRVAVNLDWAKTKQKQAALFSQVPEVRLVAKDQAFMSSPPIFAKALNEEGKRAKVGAAMDEATIDCINAAGVGVVTVSFERRTEKVQVPAVDRYTATMLQQLGQEVPLVEADRTTSSRFIVRRVSPSDLLWDTSFGGSDFDEAPWVGESGVLPWAIAKFEFSLTDADKSLVCGATKELSESLKQDDPTATSYDVDMVKFDQIFYKRAQFDPECKYFDEIWRIVFVHGKEEPVVHEPWKGQKFDEQSGTYIGSCKFPIRVLTLTYISDEAIPPSDSAVDRPNVLELSESHALYVKQRERSLPTNWFNALTVDKNVQNMLMKGVWQGWIPTKGNGQSQFGEVNRSSMPREDFEFDRIARQRSDENWQVSANQTGSFNSSGCTATEAGIVQQNYQTRIGYERARVASFFVGTMEVLAGLMALYSPLDMLGPEAKQRLEQGWDRTRISHEFAYSIFPDSTVLLDANQKIERLGEFLNKTAKSGFINPEPIIGKMAMLADIDPAEIMIEPKPPEPERPNISFRFGGEDLTTPAVQQILIQAGIIKLPQQPQLPAASNEPLPGNSIPQQQLDEWSTADRIDRRRSEDM